MKITTWNVNSLKVRLPHLLAFLDQQQPDIVALQETKTIDEQFPHTGIEAAGYQIICSGQKTYNGVAIISREAAVEGSIITAIPDFDDPQKRLLAATINGIRIINVYIPNGQAIGSEKYSYKFRWLEAFRRYLAGELQQHDRLIVLGDFNIAPADLDVHDPDRWRGRIMCSEAERAWFASLLELGLVDTVRSIAPDLPMHSWWDYRMQAFRRHWGIRIDHLLATPAVAPVGAEVATDLRALERPSDHAPVTVTFEIRSGDQGANR